MTVPTDYQFNRMFAAKSLSFFSIFLSFSRFLVIKMKSRKISIAAKQKSCQYVDVNRIFMDFEIY